MTGSGDSAVSSSSGFYIDITGPVFDLDIMLTSPIYIDVTRGQFQPVRFQASNSTIKAFWRCTDDESQVKENFWAIGKTPGGTELQEFQSVGLNVTGINSSFEGILQHNHTYYVSIICVNGGGRPTQWNDTYGVVPLLELPEVDNLNNTVLGEVKPFDETVIPSDAMESTDPDSIGFTFTVSEDKTINKYDLCIGTDKNKDDIFPCAWVGYNISGSASIKDGYLLIDDVRVRPLSELKNTFWNVSEDQTQNKTSVFHMEPGRTLFLTMRVCNEAELCTNKSLGSVLITNTESIIKRSDHGEAIHIVEYVSTDSRRRKRNAETIVLTTPEGLIPGQTIVLQPISEEDLTKEYRSDSSTDFQPYIVNPATTLDMVKRLLYKRIHSLIMTFSVIPVGHLPMPGPINITYPDTVGENEETRTALAHWNTGLQQWQLSSMTCGKTLEIDNGDETKSVEVCKTWGDEVDKINQTDKSVSYFSEETQFAVFIISKKVYNSPPILISNRFISIKEDEGTLQYQLEATDEEGDVIKFSLASQTYKLGKPLLFEDGILLYTPCTDCSGVETLTIILQEIQTNDDIPPASSETTIVITIIDSNDPPEIFLTQYGQSILSSDPTEPVLVYLEQKNIFNLNKWTEEFTAVIGAFDMEQQDLSMNVQKPMHGTLMFTDEKTTAPMTLNCETAVNVVGEPCGNFSKTLPHNKDAVSWLYTTLFYNQSMNFSGFDLLKVYFSDSMNISSTVVTIQFILMESPCHNDGLCQPKNGSNYPCTSTQRAKSFDLYYDCVCLPGWTGVYCEENIDECLGSPCLDTLECIDGDNEYQCRCPIDTPDCESKETTETLNLGSIVGIIISCIIVIILIAIIYKVYCKNRTCTNEFQYPDVADQNGQMRTFPMENLDSRSLQIGHVQGERTARDDVQQSGTSPVIERGETEHQGHTEPVPEFERTISPVIHQQNQEVIDDHDIDLIVTEQTGHSHGESDNVQQRGTIHTELQNPAVIDDDVDRIVSGDHENGNTNASTPRGVRGARVHPASHVPTETTPRPVSSLNPGPSTLFLASGQPSTPISSPRESALTNTAAMPFGVTLIDQGPSTSASASDQPSSPSSSPRESIGNDPFGQGVPNVAIPLNEYSVNYGSTATIPCTVTANPTHTSVQWKIIVNGHEQNVDMQNDKYSGGTVNSPSLVITNAEQGDETFYICTASNSVGAGRSIQTFLRVAGGPSTSASHPFSGHDSSRDHSQSADNVERYRNRLRRALSARSRRT